LEQVLSFLEVNGQALVQAETQAALREKAVELLEKARKPGEILYVGILGGTGVGKSTLINALARKEISGWSDKRPFTDKAVAYRHKDTPRGLDKIASLLRDSDALHDSDEIKDLVLLDLPDFDSKEQNNRQAVLKILPELDAVIWVVSPEKYADAAFYEFARQVAINPDNFTFVLNKADQLLEEHESDPYVKLKDVLGDLTFRLKNETRLHEPRVYCLSAVTELTNSDDRTVLHEEFKRFRDFLMVRRNAKEIASVKTANLAEGTRLLVEALNNAVQPGDKARIVATIRKLDRGLEEPNVATPLFVTEQEQKLAAAILPELLAEDQSISPVKSAMRVLGYARSIGRSQSPNLEQTLRESGETFAGRWSADLNRIIGRTDSELLLSFSRTDTGFLGERGQELVEQARSEAIAAFTAQLFKRKESLAGSRARFRRFFQKIALWAPVMILVVKLTGERAVAAFLDYPNFANAVKLSLSFLTSLFGPEGLIGLVALLICESLLIWYLAAARIRKIERYSRNLAKFGVDQLNRGMEAVTKKIRAATNEMLKDIEQGLTRLDELNAAVLPRAAGAAAHIELPRPE
jgi:GTP-binding protein EngB required for normal cell division